MKRVLPAVGMMTLAGASMLTGYEIFRPVSSSRFVSEFGSGRLPYVIALVPVAITLATYGYSLVLRWLRPRNTFLLSFALSATLPLILYKLIESGFPFASVLLYLFAQIYIVILLAQTWAWVNSTIQVNQAQKLNGWILGLASLGSTLGGYLTHQLAKDWGTLQLLPLGAGATLLSGIFAWVAFRWTGEPASQPSEKKMRVSDYFAVQMFREHKTVAWLALVVGITQVISVLFEMTFMRTLEVSMPGSAMEDARTAFLGQFWMWVNNGAIGINLLVSPLLLSRVALGWVLAIMPAIHLCTSTWQWFSPSLAAATVGFFCFKTFDYSLFNASKEILYIPLPFEARYRAKAVVDALIYRGSKGLASGALSAISIGVGQIALGAMSGAIVIFSGAWLFAVRRLARSRRG